MQIEESSSDESDEEKSLQPPTRAEVMTALNVLERYAATSNVSNTFSENLERVTFECIKHLRSVLRQKNIYDFFKPNDK